MKSYIKYIFQLTTLIILFSSCESFLEEKPKTFLSPDSYYKSQAQIKAAVNGLYIYLDDRFDGSIGVNNQTYLFLEYLPGYGDSPNPSSGTNLLQAVNLDIKEDNYYLEVMWQTAYTAIENANGVIQGIQRVTPEIIKETDKNNLLGEAYFLRAFHYFNLVRLWEGVPLKLSPTKDLSGAQIEVTPKEGVYSQIEKDLLTADSLMINNSWVSGEGRVAKGAVKTLLTKVYLTMAGYPLQKGKAYYQKAYDYAKMVTESNKFYLFDDYADLRDVANENSGEYIWMIQRDPLYAGTPVHVNLLPYPEPNPPISAAGTIAGALAPSRAFFNSYLDGDKRIEEKAYYYTKHESFDDASVIVELPRPYIYKFWDSEAAKTGRSGRNYPLLTYTDLLLMLAEAKTGVDGGSTTDATAIDAYFKVRKRAFPDELKPNSLSTDDVLIERFWEICFEGQTWFDMLRTRRALNTSTRKMINMIGYITPSHPEGRPFKEKDLVFEYPLRDKRLNPNLVRN